MSTSRRAQSVEASLIRKYFDLAAEKRLSGEEVVDLSIGQPHLPTPEPLRISARAAIEDGLNGYVPTGGYKPLLETLGDFLEQERGYRPEASMITAGACGALSLGILALAEEGDEVLLPDPYFVAYPEICHIAGATPAYYDTYPDWGLQPEKIEAAITERTRVLVVNTPANPTGAVHGEQAMRAVAELARKHDLTIIADDIYDTLIFDAPHVAMGRLYDRTLTVGGWGKSLSITGWRIGFAAGPADIVQQMIKMQMYTFVCVPGPAQKAVADCRELWPAEEAARIYREKRNYLCDRLATKYRFERPGGTFYLFPEAPGGSGSAFCERAIEQGLLVIPGIGFSRRDSHFRISFAVADDRLEQAASLLLELAG